MPPVVLLFCTPSYLLVAATSKIGLLAIIVGWLWYAVSYGIREQATKAVLGTSNVPELAVAHDWKSFDKSLWVCIRTRL
jgi:hypothetical protein